MTDTQERAARYGMMDATCAKLPNMVLWLNALSSYVVGHQELNQSHSAGNSIHTLHDQTIAKFGMMDATQAPTTETETKFAWMDIAHTCYVDTDQKINQLQNAKNISKISQLINHATPTVTVNSQMFAHITISQFLYPLIYFRTVSNTQMFKRCSKNTENALNVMNVSFQSLNTDSVNTF